MSNHLICPYCGYEDSEDHFAKWLFTHVYEHLHLECDNCDKELDYEIVLHKKEK